MGDAVAKVGYRPEQSRTGDVTISEYPGTGDLARLRTARRAYEALCAATPTNAHLRANIVRVREQIRQHYRGTRAWTAMACLTRAAELLESLDRDV